MKLLFSIFFSFFAWFSSPQTADITVTIKNIENLEGNIRIGLYTSQDNFLKEGNEFRGAVIPITASEMTYVFKDVPFGEYGISLYHDKNTDEKCNRNWIGIPTEGYAFSNNFQPMMGPPKFKDALFSLTGNLELTLEMIY